MQIVYGHGWFFGGRTRGANEFNSSTLYGETIIEVEYKVLNQHSRKDNDKRKNVPAVVEKILVGSGSYTDCVLPISVGITEHAATRD